MKITILIDINNDQKRNKGEIIRAPSMPDGQSRSVERVTFAGEEEAENRIEEAMSAYDKAMQEAADVE